MWTGIELLLVLLGVTLFGSILLALAMGYSKIELERLDQSTAPQPEVPIADMAMVTGVKSPSASEEASKNADVVAIQLAEYLRQAQASAERFVARPSAEGLQAEAHQRALWN